MAISLGTIALSAVAEAFFAFRTTRASRRIFMQLMNSIFSSQFRSVCALAILTVIYILCRWLDVTPVGRIISRCTQDINSVDNVFTDFAGILIRETLQLISLFASSIVMAGWSALIPGLVVSGLGSFLGHVYLKAQLSIRREMSNAKSPIMGQVSTALAGLSESCSFPAFQQLTCIQRQSGPMALKGSSEQSCESA